MFSTYKMYTCFFSFECYVSFSLDQNFRLQVFLEYLVLHQPYLLPKESVGPGASSELQCLTSAQYSPYRPAHSLKLNKPLPSPVAAVQIESRSPPCQSLVPSVDSISGQIYRRSVFILCNPICTFR